MAVSKLRPNKHASIGFWCPKFKTHAAFKADEKTGRLICLNCGKDFTQDMKDIYYALKPNIEMLND